MQQVWIPQRNLVFISLSNHCEGILSHFSLLHSLSSFRLWAILYAGPFTEFQAGRFFCRAWDHCAVAWSIFVQDGLIFDYNTLVCIGVFDWLNGFKVPRSCGCKTSLNHHPSHHCVLRLRWGFFVDMLCLVFPNVTLCTMTRCLHFGLVCPEVLLFLQMQLCKSHVATVCTVMNFKSLRCSPWMMCASGRLWHCGNTNPPDQQIIKTSIIVRNVTYTYVLKVNMWEIAWCFFSACRPQQRHTREELILKPNVFFPPIEMS